MTNDRDDSPADAGNAWLASRRSFLTLGGLAIGGAVLGGAAGCGTAQTGNKSSTEGKGRAGAA
ncbi:hypothetical protein AB0M20_39140, partial [Actinoplanes sp. NPDC051633]|uniref:hypothetical protein n=1 Tax=Actinoplanes sp. NPDC051633 TaxID=3155670 RepID=UPI0034407924